MKIYKYLRVIWWATAVSAVTSLSVLVSSFGLLMAFAVLNLAAYAAIVWALYHVSEESQRFGRSFFCQLMGFSLFVIATGGSLVNLGEAFAYFTVLLTITGSLFTLFSQYNLYWGLDERILPCRYVYPARRIRWCLYLPILGAVAASMLSLTMQDGMLFASAAVQLFCEFMPLVLLWQFMAAVKKAEEADF